MTAKFFAILTNQGAALLANATALGTKLNITQMAVGDGNGALPTPDATQTKLVNQKRIAPLNMLSVDANNSSQIIAEQVIPENEGGFWIREIGLYDDNGVLIAVANCPETYKPQLQEGSGRTQTIRMVLIVSSTAAVTLKIDPSVVLATRQYADDKAIGVKNYADNLMKQHVADANPHKQYAPIASPVFTGTPKAPTAAQTSNDTQLANTAFVQAAIAALVNNAPDALNTLGELAAALGNDPDFAANITKSLQGKQPVDNTLTALSGKDVAGLLQYLGILKGLDFTGDTTAPNLRGISSVTVADGTSGMTNGGVDGAGLSGNNLNIKSWNGIGFQNAYDKVIRAYIDTRLGVIGAAEKVLAGAASLNKNGDLYGDIWSLGQEPGWLSSFLGTKPGRQYITQVGLYQNDKTKPFMLHDDNSGIFLATTEMLSGYVQSIRFGAVERGSVWRSPGFADQVGYVITGIENGDSNDTPDAIQRRLLQLKVNGQWYTVGA